MGIARIKFACLLLLLSKYTAFIFLFCITGCAKPFQPPPYPYEYWYKKGVSVEEVQQAMKECEYPIYESIEPFTEYNEMAKKHICMMKKGFKYNGEYGTYCHQYPNLPACASVSGKASMDKKASAGMPACVEAREASAKGSGKARSDKQ